MSLKKSFLDDPLKVFYYFEKRLLKDHRLLLPPLPAGARTAFRLAMAALCPLSLMRVHIVLLATTYL